MNAAAKLTYETIRTQGTQRSVLDKLQTRDQLYKLLNYYSDEKRIDQQRPKS
jgi:methylisocitrate lyase